jgi:hypothetical protein
MPRSKLRPEEPEREERIEDDIVVDCHDEEERESGWFSYLQDALECPFEARCVVAKEISPLKTGEHVKVLALLDNEEPLSGEFFVQIIWGGRKMGVPLSQLAVVTGAKETDQAIEDWRYWIERRNSF